MDGENKGHKLVQTYVADRWFVSTIYRQSSACMNNPPWYYETIIWEYDPETRKRGRMYQTSGSHYGAVVAMKAHAAICVTMVEKAAKELPH